MNRLSSAPVRAALACAALFQVACVSRTQGPMRVRLEWKPTDEARLPASAVDKLFKQRVAVGTFTDLRQDPEVIGKNIETRIAAQEKGVWTVSTFDDVGAFLAGHFGEILSSNGVALVPEGPTRTISAEVQRFFVNEANTYKADVALRFTVRDGQGRTVWQGLAEGSSNRWGKSYSAENYYEALSNAFLESVKDLVKNPEFLAAFRE